jgi:hypothetical protein
MDIDVYGGFPFMLFYHVCQNVSKGEANKKQNKKFYLAHTNSYKLNGNGFHYCMWSFTCTSMN